MWRTSQRVILRLVAPSVIMLVARGELALAQTGSRVSGTVFMNDASFPSNAFVPGVSITFKSGNFERQTISDVYGRYEIVLREGNYQVSGGLAGFCPINRSNIAVEPNKELSLSIRLVICAIADGEEVDRK